VQSREATLINPTDKDVGRAVVYIPNFGDREDGVITSFNSKVVFVRYRKQHPAAGGQATQREDLDYLWGGGDTCTNQSTAIPNKK